MIKGGEFLIKDQEANDIFIPEEFGEDQLMMASATKEFGLSPTDIVLTTISVLTSITLISRICKRIY